MKQLSLLIEIELNWIEIFKYYDIFNNSVNKL